MTKLREQVMEFHREFGHPVREAPTVPPEGEVRFRARLIAEEFFEVLEALYAPNSVCGGFGDSWRAAQVLRDARELVDILLAHAQLDVRLPDLADGLADLDYVVEGTRIAMGIDGSEVADEVHRANMAKAGGVRREDGKTLKPEGWVPPDITGALKRQGWGR